MCRARGEQIALDIEIAHAGAISDLCRNHVAVGHADSPERAFHKLILRHARTGMSMCPVIHDVSFGDAEFRSSTLVDSLHKACVNHRAVERHECGLVKTVGKDDCPGEAMIQNAEYKKPEGHN